MEAGAKRMTPQIAQIAIIFQLTKTQIMVITVFQEVGELLKLINPMIIIRLPIKVKNLLLHGETSNPNPRVMLLVQMAVRINLCQVGRKKMNRTVR